MLAALSMALPASDGLFYCFPMQRIMIEDCCDGDTETHETPILTHAQCCEKMDALDVDTPVSVATAEIVSVDVSLFCRLVADVVFSSEKLDFVWESNRARGPPSRGPPASGRPIFLKHRVLLI